MFRWKWTTTSARPFRQKSGDLFEMKQASDRTRIYCPACRVFHAARLVVAGNQVFWRVECPAGPRDVRISSDATLFAKFRDQERETPPWFRKKLSNCIVHINDDCSLHCPICFEDAGRTGWRMTLDEVRKAAAKIRATGAVNVMLMGGEPMDHPQVLEILRIFSGEFGFRCSALTNGVRIGREEGFAENLKAAGLTKASVSFDAFNRETTRILRGDGSLVDVKLKAADRCFAAGLGVGFVTTATRLNLLEIPEIVRYCVAHVGFMPMLEIQCYQAAGRIVEGLEGVDREEIVKTIVASGVVPGLTEDEFRVTPSVPAAGFCISPDCGAGVLLRVRDGTPVPLTRKWGFDALLDDMASMPRGPRNVKWLRFAFAAARRVGLWFSPALLRWVGRGRPGRNELLLVSISTLMTPDHLDCKRFGRCTNGVLTATGSFCSPCFYYGLRYDGDRRART